MTSAQIGVAAANGLFVIACGGVGVRLLIQFGRTQALPEFYLGAGFCCMVGSLALLGASGLGRLAAGEVDLAALAIGLVLMWLAIFTQATFTWTVFRPKSALAENLVLAIGAGEALIVGGALHALGGADPELPSFQAAWFWTLLLRQPLALVYGWTSLEAFIQWVMARRRDRLGIGSPVVTDRFALWGWTAIIAGSSTAVSTWLHLQGRSPFADPWAAAFLGLSGLVGAILLYLAFLPPRWYLRRVEARALRRYA